jgi:hypothetical protein
MQTEQLDMLCLASHSAPLEFLAFGLGAGIIAAFAWRLLSPLYSAK